MIAAALLLDSHFAKGARLCGASNLIHILLCVLIDFSGRIVLLTCLTFMPEYLVVETDLGLTLSAGNEWR